jgi:hypothetical protein
LKYDIGAYDDYGDRYANDAERKAECGLGGLVQAV